MPVPLAIGLGFYLLDENFRFVMSEGVRLLMVADLAGLRAWGDTLGFWAPLATFLLMVIQALAAPIPAILITWLKPFWSW